VFDGREGRQVFHRLDDFDGVVGAVQIDLLIKSASLGFLLGLLALLHGLAKGAGMLSVERHLQRFLQRRSLREAHSHSNPGDGLQEHPVAAHSQCEHGSHTELEDPSIHVAGNL
jgi:hypothetical protein